MNYAPHLVSSKCLGHFESWNSDGLAIVLPNHTIDTVRRYHTNGYASLTNQPRTIVRASNCLFKSRVKPTNTPFGAPSFKVMRHLFGNRQMLVEPIKLCVEFSIEPWLIIVDGDVFSGSKKAALNQARWMHQRRDKSNMHDALRDAFATRSLESVLGLCLLALWQRQATAKGRLRFTHMKPINMAISKISETRVHSRMIDKPSPLRILLIAFGVKFYSAPFRKRTLEHLRSLQNPTCAPMSVERYFGFSKCQA
jgi:hypothetical protein